MSGTITKPPPYDGWMTDGEFLNAVALGQVTPGPGRPYRRRRRVRGGRPAGCAPGGVRGVRTSFSFVLVGARRFDRFVANPDVRRFFDGAGPAAIGAILGSAIPLALALGESWQLAVLAGAAIVLFVLRRGVVLTLQAAGAVGAIAVLLGTPVSH